MSPLLIAVEGLDGTGKSTASGSLAAAIGAHWTTTPCPELRTIRQSFDAAFARSPTARCLAYAASVIAVADEAQALQGRGQTVVVDRYWLSTLAYAPPHARPALDALGPLVRSANLTLYLRAPLAVRRQRLGDRGGLSHHDVATLEPEDDRRLDDAYLKLRSHPAAGAFVEVDASGSPAQVLAEMRRAIADHHAPGPGPCAPPSADGTPASPLA